MSSSSAPPLVDHTGLPRWTFAQAIDIAPIAAIGPSGLRKPSAVSRPPPSSEPPARRAQAVPGRIPIDSIQLAVPSRPAPPNQPNSFWAP